MTNCELCDGPIPTEPSLADDSEAGGDVCHACSNGKGKARLLRDEVPAGQLVIDLPGGEFPEVITHGGVEYHRRSLDRMIGFYEAQ